MARVYVEHVAASLPGYGPPLVRRARSQAVELRYDDPLYQRGWAHVVCDSCGNHYDAFVQNAKQRRAQYAKSRKVTALIGVAIAVAGIVTALTVTGIIAHKGLDFADSVFAPDLPWINWFEYGLLGIVVGCVVIAVASVLRDNEVRLELRSGAAPNLHTGHVDYC